MIEVLLTLAKVLCGLIVLCLSLVVLLNINNIANIIVWKFKDLSEQARIGLNEKNCKDYHKDDNQRN